MLKFKPEGVIPATLLAFNEDLSIDAQATRKHLRDCADVDGVTAITVNGHASEVHACTFDEQRELLELTADEIGDRTPIVSGVYTDSSLEAARIARMAEKAGASALLVFPPHSIGLGGHLRPEMAITHFRHIADATDLPLILFQHPVSSGVGYPLDTELRMFEEMPSIVAVKDWCADPVLHERQTRLFQSLPRPVSMLTTHSAWLMGSLTMGANGLLSGAGSVIADLQVALFRAVKSGDLHRAQAINDRMYPIVSAFYSDPFVDMHNRMKETLVLLGRMDKAVVRPPLVKLPQSEIDKLSRAIVASRLARSGAFADAAE